MHEFASACGGLMIHSAIKMKKLHGPPQQIGRYPT
jgi:hypothetical protein